MNSRKIISKILEPILKPFLIRDYRITKAQIQLIEYSLIQGYRKRLDSYGKGFEIRPRAFYEAQLTVLVDRQLSYLQSHFEDLKDKLRKR